MPGSARVLGHVPPGRWAVARDAGLVLPLVLLSTASAAWPGTGEPVTPSARWWWGATLLLVAAALIRRFHPLAAVLLAAVGGVAHQLDPYVPLQPIDLVVPWALYGLVASRRGRRAGRAAFGALLVVAYAAGLWAVWRPPVRGGWPAFPGTVTKADLVRGAAAGPGFPDVLGVAAANAIGTVMVLALAYAWGIGVRDRQERLEALSRHAEDLRREQRQRVALATAAERARIAREMHDVLAHSLAVIVAQAQAAVAVQQRHPELSAGAMREVVTVGRASLAELRQLLGVLRGDAGEGRDHAPRPGIGELPALVDRVRTAGIPVRFDVAGTPRVLPALQDMSVYRIVQEALTNTVKHAGPGAGAVVRVRFGDDGVEVEVTDDGAGPADGTDDGESNGDGEGNGLRGIAERVHLLGGHLETGPAGGRGFRVLARLPVGGHATGPVGTAETSVETGETAGDRA
ncbi:sensor histidine kinase [Streptosporangium longisporum]|uniref:histidine kinase n=1 Tax=Streptosporangium longisporum TaxID=46187 RepID=A0ABN3Y7T2_9ACTN